MAIIIVDVCIECKATLNSGDKSICKKCTIHTCVSEVAVLAKAVHQAKVDPVVAMREWLHFRIPRLEGSAGCTSIASLELSQAMELCRLRDQVIAQQEQLDRLIALMRNRSLI